MKAFKYAVYSTFLRRILSTHRDATAAGRAARKVANLRPRLDQRHSRPGADVVGRPLLLSECYRPCADQRAEDEYLAGLNGY